MNRSLFYFLLFWHVALMLAYSTESMLRGYHQLTGGTDSGELEGIQRAAGILTSLPLAQRVASYAGTATGYGFFAPRVGSSFLLEASSLDAHGIVHQTTVMPPFKQAHSLIRYHSLLSRLQYLLDDGHERPGGPTLRNRQARAIAHCLAQRIARHHRPNPAGRLRCDVYVYDTPRLWQVAVAPHPYRLLAYRHDIDHLVLP